jgi:predicted Zn-dependent protease
VNRAPDDAGIWLDLAQALQGSDRKSQALQALQVAVRLVPTDCDAWSKLASLAGSLGFSGLAAEARRSFENLSKPATAANGIAAKATPDAAVLVSKP